MKLFDKSLKFNSLMFIIFGIYLVISDNSLLSYSVFNVFILIFSNSYFMLLLFMSMLYTGIKMIKNYDNSYPTIVRYENREKYMLELFKAIYKRNALIYIISFASVFFPLILKSLYLGRVLSTEILLYQFPDYIYLIYYLLKVYILFQLIVFLNIYLYKFFKQSIILVFLISIVDFLFIPINQIVINYANMNFNFSSYTQLVQYSDFMLELSALSIFGILITLILIVCNKIFQTKNLDIGE